jgi:hypothetical protein
MENGQRVSNVVMQCLALQKHTGGSLRVTGGLQQESKPRTSLDIAWETLGLVCELLGRESTLQIKLLGLQRPRPILETGQVWCRRGVGGPRISGEQTPT